jgi:16S rRNA G966 N2-methylase RsmD
VSEPERKRRSLTHVGGTIERGGSAKAAELLAHALDVAPAKTPEGSADGATDDEPDRVHVHGFHAYPARMHPTTARRLVEAFAAPSHAVLDPFCGSGTVLVESLLAGRVAVGSDLNPLAVLLASRKLARRSETEHKQLLEAAAGARALADERRVHRVGATHRYGPEDMQTFDPHVLLELDSLRAHILGLPGGPTRQDLWLVLSAILVKVSKKRGDTSGVLAPRRLAAGYTSKLFVRKAEELVRRVRELEAALPKPRPSHRVERDDATKLPSFQERSMDAIVTSPPYAATYDYLEHHALRLRWLGLETRTFEADELGARRNYATLSPAEALRAWEEELGSFFTAAHRVLRRGAPMILLMADSEVRQTPIRAEEVVARVAESKAFRPIARASQSRPHFHGSQAFRDAPRREHALLLEKS